MTVTTVQSPAKFILFGEHAVVYGEPAIAVAIELPLTVKANMSRSFLVDGQPLESRTHAYIKNAIERYWKGDPISIVINSKVPRASGLGSSAAVTVATLGALQAIGETGTLVEEDIARSAFEVEYEVQGRASPTDTSTCAHGKAIMLSKKKGKDLLWNIEKDGKSWFIHDLDIKEATFVLGDTRQRGRTGQLVEKVRRYYEKSGLARETIREIGDIALDGAKGLKEGDLVKTGSMMDLNHKRLVSLGVGNNKLEKLIRAAAPTSYGAKLTGAGGGGCMVALTDRPKETAEAIERAGGIPIIARTAKKGVRIIEA